MGLVRVQGIRSWVFAVIYTSNNDDERIGLWNILERVCRRDFPTMIIGDYNVIATESEKKGGRLLVNRKVCNFRSFITEAGLCNLEFIRAKYT